MRRFNLILIGAIALGASAVASAADAPLDVTIQVVDSPNDLPAAVTKTIQLPPAAAAAARENAQFGLDRANAARTGGREFGRSIADDAKTRDNPGRGRRP